MNTSLVDYIRQIVPNPVYSDYMSFASIENPKNPLQHIVNEDFTKRGAKLIILRSVVLYNINSAAANISFVETFNQTLIQYNAVNGNTMNGFYKFDYVIHSRLLFLKLIFTDKIAGAFTAQVQYVYDQESKTL